MFLQCVIVYFNFKEISSVKECLPFTTGACSTTFTVDEDTSWAPFFTFVTVDFTWEVASAPTVF